MAMVDDNSLKEIEKILNETMLDLMYPKRQDAYTQELMAAAACFNTLKLLNLKIGDGSNIDEKQVRSFLEKDNICDENFLLKYNKRT